MTAAWLSDSGAKLVVVIGLMAGFIYLLTLETDRFPGLAGVIIQAVVVVLVGWQPQALAAAPTAAPTPPPADEGEGGP